MFLCGVIPKQIKFTTSLLVNQHVSDCAKKKPAGPQEGLGKPLDGNSVVDGDGVEQWFRSLVLKVWVA